MSRHQAAARETPRQDLYTRVTKSIVADLELGFGRGRSLGPQSTWPARSPGRCGPQESPTKASMSSCYGSKRPSGAMSRRSG